MVLSDLHNIPNLDLNRHTKQVRNVMFLFDESME